MTNSDGAVADGAVADVLAVASGVWHGVDGVGASWAFTGSIGGVSAPPYAGANLANSVGDDPRAVQANRLSAAALVMPAGLDGASRPQAPGSASGPAMAVAPAVVMRAEHGANVEVVGAQHLGSTVEHVDGLVTDEAGVPLMALAADCVPVLVADLVAGVVGAAHCGWRGAQSGIIPALLQTMTSAGADPRRCRAIIGPSICGDCYEVGDDVASLFRDRYPTAVAATVGRTTLDVSAVVGMQLTAGGVVEVEQIRECTAESERLFSYRRDGVTGRQGAVIVLQRASGARQDDSHRADPPSPDDATEVRGD